MSEVVKKSSGSSSIPGRAGPVVLESVASPYVNPLPTIKKNKLKVSEWLSLGRKNFVRATRLMRLCQLFLQHVVGVRLTVKKLLKQLGLIWRRTRANQFVGQKRVIQILFLVVGRWQWLLVHQKNVVISFVCRDLRGLRSLFETNFVCSSSFARRRCQRNLVGYTNWSDTTFVTVICEWINNFERNVVQVRLGDGMPMYCMVQSKRQEAENSWIWTFPTFAINSCFLTTYLKESVHFFTECSSTVIQIEILLTFLNRGG